MASRYRNRRLFGILLTVFVSGVLYVSQSTLHKQVEPIVLPVSSPTVDSPALDELATLPTKGRAPKTGYTRTQFGSGWTINQGCDTRNIILRRDLVQTSVSADCKILSGLLIDPYTNKTIAFQRGETTSQLIQIDHVVALSNAWQTGAQQLALQQREAFANDPLNLLAVDGAANQQKSDGDAATWLPANKSFRCQYVARQIAVKKKYLLWVTISEKDAMSRVLVTCPTQTIPS